MKAFLKIRARGRIIACILTLLVVASGAVCLVLSKIKAVRVPVLMYHRIGDAEDSPWWVTPGDFANQLRCLREQGYQSIVPSDLAAHQRWGWPLPPKPVLITFDDGYLTTLENAEPLLKKEGFRAVCYLITGKVSESPGTRQAWEGTPLLTWPEVRDMEKRGTVVFGGHSRNHANLRALADPWAEISGCYRDLKKKGGFKPEGFCYPYGQYKDTTEACVVRAKFTTAMTCDDGIAETTPTLNLFELPRVAVMGGRHRFQGHAIAGDGGHISVCVSKEGRRLEVCPRLVWPGEAANSQQGWLTPVQLSEVPALLTWDLSKPVALGDPVLELWDNFHMIRYWQASFSSLNDRR